MSTRAIVAAAIVTAGLMAGVPRADAGCREYVTHWGRVSPTPDYARSMAFAGMDWKIRNRLGDTVRLVRGVRIEQCKPRGRHSWQCQASVIVDRCF